LVGPSLEGGRGREYCFESRGVKHFFQGAERHSGPGSPISPNRRQSAFSFWQGSESRPLTHLADVGPEALDQDLFRTREPQTLSKSGKRDAKRDCTSPQKKQRVISHPNRRLPDPGGRPAPERALSIYMSLQAAGPRTPRESMGAGDPNFADSGTLADANGRLGGPARGGKSHNLGRKVAAHPTEKKKHKRKKTKAGPVGARTRTGTLFRRARFQGHPTPPPPRGIPCFVVGHRAAQARHLGEKILRRATDGERATGPLHHGKRGFGRFASPPPRLCPQTAPCPRTGRPHAVQSGGGPYTKALRPTVNHRDTIPFHRERAPPGRTLRAPRNGGARGASLV